MFCFIDYRTTSYERISLENLGLKCIEVPKTSLVYPSIDGHVDIQLNILNKNSKQIIIHKDMCENFRSTLCENNISYIESSSSLGYNYPENIILNSLIMDNYFIHNIKFTDDILLKSQQEKNIISVNQGYTKCSCLPINSSAIITNDIGIYKTLMDFDLDILYLPPGDILLPGLSYGFIGGVGGMINNNSMAFFGDLNSYIHGDKVKKFLYKYDVEPVFLKEGKLSDRGSLLVL